MGTGHLNGVSPRDVPFAGGSPSAKGTSRRQFVCGMALAAGLLCVGGGVALAAPQSGVLRPPGAQDERAFLGACVRCGRCAAACPTHAIRPLRLEDGVAVMRTPGMAFDRGGCTMEACGYRCRAACPTGALLPFDLASDALGKAVVHIESCVAYGLQGGCRVCVEACPYQAIELDGDGRPFVVEDACNGCGICECACPSASYRAYEYGTARGIAVEAAQSVQGGGR